MSNYGSYRVFAGDRALCREALQREAAERAARDAAARFVTITCQHPDVRAHDTCSGNSFPERCLCRCHDERRPAAEGTPE